MNRLNLRTDNFNSMVQQRKRGRPREWVLDEEIIEFHRLTFELKTENPTAHWSDIKRMLRTKLEQTGRHDLLPKFDRLWGLTRRAIPLPPRCICGYSTYSYTYNKDEDTHWEILARCINPTCRYERRYLPGASYSWSRPKSIIKELEKLPTFYELDGQRVEGDE